MVRALSGKCQSPVDLARRDVWGKLEHTLSLVRQMLVMRSYVKGRWWPTTTKPLEAFDASDSVRCLGMNYGCVKS